MKCIKIQCQWDQENHMAKILLIFPELFFTANLKIFEFNLEFSPVFMKTVRKPITEIKMKYGEECAFISRRLVWNLLRISSKINGQRGNF
jgi:hypothetical protein